MKNCILHILCEGQTEERFVQKVLAPYLHPLGIHPKPTILMTSSKKKTFGGMLSYQQVINDLTRIFRSIKSTPSETNIVTTMLDFYALPNDFPDFDIARQQNAPQEKVAILETALNEVFNNRFFLPYIQLHEFEALLFANISKLHIDYPEALAAIETLKTAANEIGDPELINNSPETAPSKRIIKALQNAKYKYDKVGSGTRVSLAITLPVILEKCSHFRNWIDRIISLSNSLDAEKSS